MIAPSHTQDLLLWNNPPRETPQSTTLTVFKSKLTIYFFRLAYNPSWYYNYVSKLFYFWHRNFLSIFFLIFIIIIQILLYCEWRKQAHWLVDFFLWNCDWTRAWLAVMSNALLKRPKYQNSKNCVWISKENPTISLTAAARARKVIKSMKHRNWKTSSIWRIYISELLSKPGFVRCCGWWNLRKS